jgi:transcriptional regulator with XRE-family HTH domain
VNLPEKCRETAWPSAVPSEEHRWLHSERVLLLHIGGVLLATMDGATLGTLLRIHRIRALLSQEQLAALAQLGVRTIRDLERGRVQSPHPRSVRQLAAALRLEGELLAEFETVAQRERWARRLQIEPATRGISVFPAQLPTDIADFTDRGAAQQRIYAFLANGSPPARVPNVAAIGAISGQAGAGKTTLAVHLAHRLRTAFPDGQLYADLHGSGERPLDPTEVVGQFLRALGVEGARIPLEIDDSSSLLRERLVGRKVLIVLDNAANERQIRPLVPGTSSCAVLITSRARLGAIEATQQIDLGVFNRAKAIELLSRIAGAERVAAEPEAASQIVDHCGHLPLAIRIAGAKLAGRPYSTLKQLADSLADEHRRLDELACGDLAVRASVDSSYQLLDPAQRRAFKLLGLLNAADFTLWTAGAMLDMPKDETEDIVESLVDARLVEIVSSDVTGNPRYGFRDLVRLHARERAEAEETESSRRDAIMRGTGLGDHGRVRGYALPCTSDVLIRGGAPRVSV